MNCGRHLDRKVSLPTILLLLKSQLRPVVALLGESKCHVKTQCLPRLRSDIANKIRSQCPCPLESRQLEELFQPLLPFSEAGLYLPDARPKLIDILTIRLLQGVQALAREGNGYGSTRLCLGFQDLVRPEGLEPPTLCSEGRCSIQLSYGRTAAPETTFIVASESRSAHPASTPPAPSADTSLRRDNRACSS